MDRCRLVATFAAFVMLMVGSAGLGGCGTDKPTTVDGLRLAPLVYRPGRPVQAHVSAGGREGGLRLERVSYTSVDGQRVPALFAIPANRAPLGCLVYQGDVGQTKEAFPQLRAGAGRLRLATFTIDPRDAGARGSAAAMAAAYRTPETLRALILDTVVDLRKGLDYLEGQPVCRRRVAYLGTGFGAAVGAVFGGEDARLKAVVLTSIGATYEEALLVGSAISPDNPDVPVPNAGAPSQARALAHAVRVLGPYDPAKWVAKIAPRPVMLINGRFDPLVVPADALELAAAANKPKTVLYFDGGHDPFAPSPDQRTVARRLTRFLVRALRLPGSP